MVEAFKPILVLLGTSKLLLSSQEQFTWGVHDRDTDVHVCHPTVADMEHGLLQYFSFMPLLLKSTAQFHMCNDGVRIRPRLRE